MSVAYSNVPLGSNRTCLRPGPIPTPRRAPRVEYDGLRALVSYQEEISAGNQDIFCVHAQCR